MLIAPLLEIVARPGVAAPAAKGAAGLVFTSENGAAVAAAEIPAAQRRLAWCVGGRTAAVAAAAGFAVRTGPGNALGLIDAIVADPPVGEGPLVHLHGAEVRCDVAAGLRARGVTAHAAVVYEQQAVPLAAAAQDLLAGAAPVLAPVFSPRSARLLAPALAVARAPVAVAAISPAAAAELPPLPAGRLAIAASPDSPAMLAALAKLLCPGENS